MRPYPIPAQQESAVVAFFSGTPHLEHVKVIRAALQLLLLKDALPVF